VSDVGTLILVGTLLLVGTLILKYWCAFGTLEPSRSQRRFPDAREILSRRQRQRMRKLLSSLDSIARVRPVLRTLNRCTRNGEPAQPPVFSATIQALVVGSAS
jgi:hypothetical protein